MVTYRYKYVHLSNRSYGILIISILSTHTPNMQYLVFKYQIKFQSSYWHILTCNKTELIWCNLPWQLKYINVKLTLCTLLFSFLGTFVYSNVIVSKSLWLEKITGFCLNKLEPYLFSIWRIHFTTYLRISKNFERIYVLFWS